MKIKIANQEFPTKKAALQFYQNLLAGYQIGEVLSESDKKAVVNLVYRDSDPEEVERYELETGDCIKTVIVDAHPDFKRTKCFYLVEANNERTLFSYRLAINGDLSSMQKFTRACRNTVQVELRAFKAARFANRPVKCAISGKIVEWEECQVDHKSPLTFSVIVKSFIVSNALDVDLIEYVYQNSSEFFASPSLSEKFSAFHREMAVLRIVATEENAKLASKARILPTSRDGKIS